MQRDITCLTYPPENNEHLECQRIGCWPTLIRKPATALTEPLMGGGHTESKSIADCTTSASKSKMHWLTTLNDGGRREFSRGVYWPNFNCDNEKLLSVTAMNELEVWSPLECLSAQSLILTPRTASSDYYEWMMENAPARYMSAKDIRLLVDWVSVNAWGIQQQFDYFCL